MHGLTPSVTEGSQLAPAHFENSDLEFAVRDNADTMRSAATSIIERPSPDSVTKGAAPITLDSFGRRRSVGVDSKWELQHCTFDGFNDLDGSFSFPKKRNSRERKYPITVHAPAHGSRRRSTLVEYGEERC